MLDFLKNRVSAEELATKIVERSFDGDIEARDLAKVRQINKKEINEQVFLFERKALRLFIAVTVAQPYVKKVNLWERFESGLTRAMEAYSDSLGLKGVLIVDGEVPMRFSELVDERVRSYLESLLGEGSPDVCQQFASLCREGAPQERYDDDTYFPFATATYKMVAQEMNGLCASVRIV